MNNYIARASTYRNRSACVQPASGDRENRVDQNGGQSVFPGSLVLVPIFRLPMGQKSGTRGSDHTALFGLRKSWRRNRIIL